MINDALKAIGLSDEQTAIYMALLTHGPQRAAQLSKNSQVQRTYVYRICQDLAKLELVEFQHKGDATVFAPTSPDRLVTIAEDHKDHAVQAQTLLTSVLQTLKTQFQNVESKPIVTHFEGEEGIFKANLEVLAEKQEILAYLVINKDIDKKMEKYWEKYYTIRIRDKIPVRAITSDTKEGIEYKNRDGKEFRETRLVPKDKFPIAIEKNIVGNKVAFFSTQEGKPIATLIVNKDVADAERAIFELAWSEAEKYNRNK